MIIAAQIRAARALLSLSQTNLSLLADVGVATVKRIEIADEIRGSVQALWKIQKALEEAGVEFIPADETKGPGVRLKQSTQKKAPKGGRRGKARTI